MPLRINLKRMAVGVWIVLPARSGVHETPVPNLAWEWVSSPGPSCSSSVTGVVEKPTLEPIDPSIGLLRPATVCVTSASKLPPEI